jgi:soluble lytic murein transglycosylase-like protein
MSVIETGADIYKSTSSDGSVTFTDAPTNKNAKVIIKEQKPSRAYKKTQQKSSVKNKKENLNPKESFNNIVEEKARQHNVDPKLVKSVIKAESNWNPAAVSPKGALGLMQLMPSTANLMGVNDPFDPHENISAGIRYLKYLLEKFNGNLTLALAAYNAGPGLVERLKAIPSIPETVIYVKRVIKDYSGTTIFPSYYVLDKKGRNDKIQKVVLQDGTVLFTNSYLTNSYPSR